MKKKTLCGCLTLAVILSLSTLLGGCSSSKTPAQPTTETSQKLPGKTPGGKLPIGDSETVTDASTTPENTEVPDAPKAEQPTKSKIALQNPHYATVDREMNYEDASGNILLYGAFSEVTLYDGADPVIQKSLDEVNKAKTTIWDTYEKKAKADADAMANDGIGTSSLYDLVYFGRADSKYLSIADTLTYYTAGNYDNADYFTSTYTVDLETGKMMALSDVLADPDVFLEALIGTLYAQKENSIYPISDNYEESVQQLYKSNKLNWLLEGDGIRVIFNPDQVAPGTLVEARVLISENESAFRPEYFSFVDDSIIRVTPLYLGEENQFVISDGLVVYGGQPFADMDGSDFYNNYRISYFGDITEVQDDFWLYDVYLVYSGGKTYMYLEQITMNEYTKMSIYEVHPDRAPTYVCDIDNVSFRYITNSSSKSICGMSRIDLLGTFSGVRPYSVKDNALVADHEEYAFYSYDGNGCTPITSTVALSVLVDGEEVILPPGTNFTPVSGVMDEYMKALLDDGSLCEIHYSIDSDGLPIIDGRDAFECFETLYFAG